MAIFLKKHNVLFLQVPGTASTSLEQALLAVDGAHLIGEKHATLPQIDLDCFEGVGPPKDVACVIRNHFDIIHAEWFRSRTRWVYELDGSALQWGHEKRLEIKVACSHNFSDYVRWLLSSLFSSKAQSKYFEHFTKYCSNVFKFENINEISDWLKVTKNVGIELKKANMAGFKEPYWRDYDADARQMVATVFADELAAFNYYF